MTPTLTNRKDDSSIINMSGASLILTSPEGFVIQQALRFKFSTTNNKTKYEALLAGIRLVNSLEVKQL